jgi:hypothetical protein
MFDRVLAVVLQVAACGWVVFAWLRWLKNHGSETHSWRGVVLLIAFLLTTFSLAVVVGLSVRAHIHGGYRFMELPQVIFMFAGFFAALLAVMGAVVGKGNARLACLFCSIFSVVALMMEYRAD